MPPSVVNYLTIDFEEWYQGLVSASARLGEWASLEPRLPAAGAWILDALAEKSTKATFFIVGRTAEEHPALVKRIAQDGHEIALHGYLHRLVCRMDRRQFVEDLNRNIQAVQSATGVRPAGYRAPRFSISAETGWFWEALAECGLRYDSSVFPIRTPFYGIPNGNRFPYDVNTPSGIVREFPISTLRAGFVNLPFSGGFYFRALPYGVVRWAFRRANRAGQPVVFYTHPFEYDPGHARPHWVTARERITHYAFLAPTRRKFMRLLSEFSFAPLGTALEPAA